MARKIGDLEIGTRIKILKETSWWYGKILSHEEVVTGIEFENNLYTWDIDSYVLEGKYFEVLEEGYKLGVDDLEEVTKMEKGIRADVVNGCGIVNRIKKQLMLVENGLKNLREQELELLKMKSDLELKIRSINAPEEVEFKYEETILLENGFEAERIYLFFRDLRSSRRYHTFREDLIKVSNHLYNRNKLTKVLKELRIHSCDVASYVVLAGKMEVK